MRPHVIALISYAILAAQPCGAAIPTWTEFGDAGDEALTAQDVLFPGGSTVAISGSTGPADLVDMYVILIGDAAGFSASTAFGGASWDTELFLFSAASGLGLTGVQANDNGVTPGSGVQSILGGPLSPGEPGPGIVDLSSYFQIYTLAVTGSGVSPYSAGGDIFELKAPFQQSGPDGPGGALPLIGWHGAGGFGNYTITITGFGYIPNPPSMMLLALAALAGPKRRRG